MSSPGRKARRWRGLPARGLVSWVKPTEEGIIGEIAVGRVF